jgi:hypothetical protein
MQSLDGRFKAFDMQDMPLAVGVDAAKADRFAFRCRLRGGHCSVNLRGRGHDIPQRSWSWNGDIEKPTLSPSINCGDCGWHGFIENGVYLDTNRSPEADQGVR